MDAPNSTPHGLVARTRWVLDRGERPVARGFVHAVAFVLSLIAGTVLCTFGWMALPWLQALGVTIYAVGLALLFGVSAFYHRGPWRRASTVTWWRRADHATIAVFIASTYTPLCLIVLPSDSATVMLITAWAGAAAGVALSLGWINHPRWLDVVVYLVLGWLVLPLAPQLWNQAGAAVVLLLLAGGVVYSAGAVIYALKWPGRQAQWFGYHEYFHLATLIAAVLHLVAVWMVVVQSAT